MDNENIKQIDILNLCQPYCKQYNIKLEKNDLSQYISGKVQPKQDKLTILGLALNVNEVWLMGYNVPKGLNALDSVAEDCSITDLSEEEQELLNSYNKLDINDKGEIKGEIKHMLKSEKYSIKKGLSKT